MFSEKNWVSIGIKPKAKDLKSVIEDLNQMEYLQNLEDYQSTIVLDGRKVRLGFEGSGLDPFSKNYSEQSEQLQDLARVFGDEKAPTQAILELSVVLNQKLDQMLLSEDPFIYEVFRGLNFQASMKFHNKQFQRILKKTS